MVSYEAFDQDVKINGQTVLTIVNEGMGKFSAAYQERAGESRCRYEAISVDGETAPELVWEVMEQLKQRLLEPA